MSDSGLVICFGGPLFTKVVLTKLSMGHFAGSESMTLSLTSVLDEQFSPKSTLSSRTGSSLAASSSASLGPFSAGSCSTSVSCKNFSNENLNLFASVSFSALLLRY